MTSAWDHLPNAGHIDRVLASVKANPDLWDAELDAAQNAVRDAAQNAVRDAGRSHAAREAAWEAGVFVVIGKTVDVLDSARGAILALIVYVDCIHMLDSDAEEIRALAGLGVPAAVLLLPACIAFAKEKELA